MQNTSSRYSFKIWRYCTHNMHSIFGFDCWFQCTAFGFKSRPSENFLIDFCNSVILKALKFNLLYSKESNVQAFRSAELQKSVGEFLHGLDFSYFLRFLTIILMRLQKSILLHCVGACSQPRGFMARLFGS